MEGSQHGIAWFKRDLRRIDHAAPVCAAAAGPILCLCVIEPSLWGQQDAAARRYHFVLECLEELDADPRRHDRRMHVIVGEVSSVLDRLHARAPFAARCSHQETGMVRAGGRHRPLAAHPLTKGN